MQLDIFPPKKHSALFCTIRFISRFVLLIGLKCLTIKPMKSSEYIFWDLLQANYGLIETSLIVVPNCVLESLHRQTAHTLLYETREGPVGGLRPHTLITGAGQTGTPFLQSEFGSQS